MSLREKVAAGEFSRLVSRLLQYYLYCCDIKYLLHHFEIVSATASQAWGERERVRGRNYTQQSEAWLNVTLCLIKVWEKAEVRHWNWNCEFPGTQIIQSYFTKKIFLEFMMKIFEVLKIFFLERWLVTSPMPTARKYLSTNENTGHAVPFCDLLKVVFFLYLDKVIWSSF